MQTFEAATVIADFFLKQFTDVCEPGRCRVAGGMLRKKPYVHDLEFVLQPIAKAPPPVFGIKAKDQPKTLLDKKLNDLETIEFLYFVQGADRNKKYWVNMERFSLPPDDEFKLDLWITVPPAQYGVNMVIRTGPGSDQNNFSKWIVTPRASGGALPDGYRVKHCAVWRVDQLDAKDQPFEGESPLLMPTAEDFLDFVGVTAEPEDRRADWGRWIR